MGWLNKLFDWESIFGEPSKKSPAAMQSVAPAAEDTSANNAASRLKLVLMHDRTQLSPEELTKMRDEMVEVISRYVEVDKKALELKLERTGEGNTIALVANIPVLKYRIRKVETPEDAVKSAADESTDSKKPQSEEASKKMTDSKDALNTPKAEAKSVG